MRQTFLLNPTTTMHVARQLLLLFAITALTPPTGEAQVVPRGTNRIAAASGTARLIELRPGLNPALDITRDGAAIAYVVSPVGAEYTTIWVKELANSSTVQLPGRVSQRREEGTRRAMVRPRWSPDGSRLAYLADARNGTGLALHIWNRRTRAHREVTERNACAGTCPEYDIQWSPDGRFLFYLSENEAVRALNPGAYPTGGAMGSASLTERRRLMVEDPQNGGVTVRVSPPERDRKGEPATRPLRALSDVVAVDVASAKTVTVFTGADVNKLFLSPDGRTLLVTALGGVEGQVRQAYQDFFVLSLPGSWPWAGAKSGFVSDAHTPRDWRGIEIRPLLDSVKQFYVGRAAWDPSSRRIAFAEQGALAKGDVFILDADRGETRNLTAELELPVQPEDRSVSDPSKISGRTFAYAGKFGQVYVPPIWSRDGKSLFALRDGDEGTEIWSIPTDAGRALRLTTGGQFDVLEVLARNGVAVSGPSRSVIVATVRFADQQLGFVAIDPDDDAMKTLARFTGWGLFPYPRAFLAPSAVAPVLAFVNETASAPQEIFTLDLRTSAVEQVTALNRALAARDGGERRTVSWTRPDGVVRHALLHLPPAAARRRQGLPPVIMQIYPGSTAREIEVGQFINRADLYLKPLYELLQEGYAVLKPSIVIKAGGGACVDVGEEVVRALDAAGATGLVDTSRAAIMGHSFGGWTVNCVVTQTDRFKAAVGVAGLADMISNAFSPDQATWALGGGQTNIDRTLWEAPELYLRESPAIAAPKVKTPLLLIHGKDDANVPVEQSVEMYVALSRLRKTVTYVAYDKRGHSDVADHPDYGKRVKEWFARYLEGSRPITP